MSDLWKQPSKRRSARSSVATGTGEDWSTRLLATLVAIPVFALSLYVCLATILLSPRAAGYIYLSLPIGFHLTYFALALIVALRYGMSGITKLLGHLFGTHFADERDRRITLVLWSCLAVATLIAYLISQG
jgi:hypothetical protein